MKEKKEIKKEINNKIIKKKSNPIKPVNFESELLSYSENILININERNKIITKKNNYNLVKIYYKDIDKYALIKLIKNLNPEIFNEIRYFHNYKTEKLTLEIINKSIKIYKKDELIIRENLNLIIFIIKIGFIKGMSYDVIITFKYLIKLIKEYNLNGIEELNKFIKYLNKNLKNEFIYKGNEIKLEEKSFLNVFDYLIEILNIFPFSYINYKIIENLLFYKKIKVKKILNKFFKKNSSIEFLKALIKNLNLFFIDLLVLFNYEDVFIEIFNEIFFKGELINNEYISNEMESNSIYSNKIHNSLFKENFHNVFLLKLLLTTSLNKIHKVYNINLIFKKSLIIFNKYFSFLMNLFSETRKFHEKNKGIEFSLKEINYFYNLINLLIKFFKNNLLIKKSEIRLFFIKQKLIKENQNILLAETKELYQKNLKETELFCRIFNGFIIFLNNFINENFNIFIRKYLRNSKKNNISLCFYLNFFINNFKNEKLLDLKSLFFLILNPNFNLFHKYLFIQFLKNLTQNYLINCIFKDKLFSKNYSINNFNIIYGGFFQQIRKLYLIESLNVDIKEFFISFSSFENIFIENNKDISLFIKRENILNMECINGKESDDIDLFNQFGEFIEYRSDQSTIQVQLEVSRLCLDPFE